MEIIQNMMIRRQSSICLLKSYKNCSKILSDTIQKIKIEEKIRILKENDILQYLN